MKHIAVTHLKSLKAKSVGLLGANHAHPVYFTTRWGIHTFGLLFPIDVLVLDKDNKVAHVAHQLKPNAVFVWNPKHFHVIELPAGEIQKMDIVKGDTISLLFK